MKIRTAIFGVYVAASALGFAVIMALVLRDVRLRYVESMRRTLGDTAVFLAAFAAEGDAGAPAAWARKLRALPPNAELLRVFACDAERRVVFDSAYGRDVGQVYAWSMTGGGRLASSDYTLANVAEVDGELRVLAPVREGGVVRGWVGVGRPLAVVSEGVSAARWRLATYALLVAAAMVAAGWWIATRLTQSLERLTQYAVAVRDGRAAVPPVSSAQEVAALARAFEEMRVALEGKAYVERYTQALAHELKAPLAAIRGAAELLGEEMPRGERARFIANLRAESARVQRVVDQLLELAALEARRAPAEFAPVDLRELVAEVIAAARGLAEARGVEIAVDAGDAGAVAGGAVTVRGERVHLGQAVGNLIQNAIEFSPAGGVVAVTIGMDGGRAVVRVDDAGPGVPAYAVEKVFDRFYSLPRPDTGRKSSGLGLSIVREVARLHGGEATLENRAGGGARATLTLRLG